MAYTAVASSGRDYVGENGFRPPDEHSNSGNGEFRKRLGSMDSASNVDSPNQVHILPARLSLEAEVHLMFEGDDNHAIT